MTTSLTGGSAGDFWHRLGEFEGCVLDLLSLQGGSTTSNIGSSPQLPTRLSAWFTDLISNGTADYQTATALQQAVSTAQSAAPDMVTAIATAAGTMLINAAQAVQPLTTINDINTAFTLLVEKMNAASATINQGTLPSMGAQTAVTWVTPVGNPTFVWSVVDSAGRGLQYVYPGEIITVTITGDSQDGTTTAGQEPYSVVGQGANPNSSLDYNWLVSGKYGSGASQTGNLADPLTDNTSSTATAGTNVLVNGAVKVTTTSNQVDNWNILTGSAGSTITATAGSGGYITGSGILTMVSDGSTDLAITQAFNTASSTTVGAGGTPYALLPSAANNLELAVFVPYKLSASSPAAGNLRIELIDGGGSTIADDASVNNQINVDLTLTGDTNWHIASGVFRLPKSLPTSTPYKLKIWQSTAVTSGKNVILSCMAMTPMTQLYAAGPYFAGFRGSTNPNSSGAFPDAWTFTLSATIGKLQKAIFRYYNPPGIGSQNPGLVIPAVSSGSATLSDTLVA